MKSRWYELKDTAIELRRTGMSIKTIEEKLGIPRSTLSGWLKHVELSEEQRCRLMKNKHDGWKKAREKAVESHRAQKTLRLLKAKQEAEATLASLDLNSAVLDLAFAMLYLGEGAKGNASSIANSDPKILRFVIAVLKRNYSIEPEQIRCELHLRADQDHDLMKQYWSTELKLPISCFGYVAVDQRTAGKATYDHYKGVCVISCGGIAIQRKIVYLYNLFCDKVAELDAGA